MRTETKKLVSKLLANSNPKRTVRAIELSDFCKDPQNFHLGDTGNIMSYVDRQAKFLLNVDNKYAEWNISTVDYHSFFNEILIVSDMVKKFESCEELTDAQEKALKKAKDGLSKMCMVIEKTFPVAIIAYDEGYNDLYHRLSGLLEPKPFIKLSLSGISFPLSTFDHTGITHFRSKLLFGETLLKTAEKLHPKMIYRENAIYKFKNFVVSGGHKTYLKQLFADFKQEVAVDFPYTFPSYAISVYAPDGKEIINEMIAPTKKCTKKESLCQTRIKFNI